MIRLPMIAPLVTVLAIEDETFKVADILATV